MQHVYSGFITANEGFNAPEPFNGPSGWTVYKEQQTEIFVITHNLNLSNPHKLHVVVTTAKSLTFANVESMTTNSFTVSVWGQAGTPAMTDINFVAVQP